MDDRVHITVQGREILCGAPFGDEVRFFSLSSLNDTYALTDVCGVCHHRRMLMAAAQPAAVKHDTGKPRYDLLPPDALKGAALAFGFGAKKYASWNYLAGNGLEWMRIARAAMSHLFEWILGNELDEESGLPHLDHFVANALMLSTLVKRKRGTDDRWRG